MKLYIKDRKTFATVGMADCVDWDIIEDSDAAEYSTFTLAPGALGFGDVGQWIIADGAVLRVDMVTPTAEQASVRCLPAWTMFDLNTVYDEDAAHPATAEAFIAGIIETDYIEQTDAAYRTDYIDLTWDAGTAFAAPDIGSAGTFTLADYIAATADVSVTFAVSGRTLRVHVAPRAKAARKLVFGDGHTLVTSQAFSADSVAKVTTNQDGALRAFYLAADGTVSETVPAERAEGSWAYIAVAAKDDPAEKAAAEFSKNKSAHKIEFLSDFDLAVGDVVTARLDGKMFAGAVSRRGRSSAGGKMRNYTIGDLAVTASDKLRRI